jgi:hypothetical protein
MVASGTNDMIVKSADREFPLRLADAGRRRERTTFADGTTVTVNWDANTVQVKPDVSD